MNSEYKNTKQRLAVCHSQYKRAYAMSLLAEQGLTEAAWNEIEFDNFLLLK